MKKLELLEILSRYKLKYKNLGVTQIGLFGSAVRNEATEQSDIDILLVVDEKSDFTYFTYGQIYAELSEQLPRKIEVALEKNLKPDYRNAILNEVEYA